MVELRGESERASAGGHAGRYSQRRRRRRAVPTLGMLRKTKDGRCLGTPSTSTRLTWRYVEVGGITDGRQDRLAAGHLRSTDSEDRRAWTGPRLRDRYATATSVA